MSTISDEYEAPVDLELIHKLQVNPFVRKRWFEAENRRDWEEKLNLAIEAYRELEFLTVEAGIRDCTTRNIMPEDLQPFQERLAERDLYYQPIRKIGAYTGAAGFHTDPDSTKNWKFYGVVSNSLDAADRFVEASADPEAQARGGPGGRANHRRLGKLLGYPDCCIEFFEKNFLKKRYLDPFWQIALNTTETYVDKVQQDKIKLKGTPWQLNVLLRCEQVKISPHLPCSFDCEKTLEFTEEWLALGRENNLEGIEEIEEILNLPVSWSCSKGVAKIRTPFFEMQTNSQASTPRVEVVLEREGEDL